MKLTIRNPATAETLRSLKADTKQSVAKEVRRARSGQAAWAKVPFKRRRAALARFERLIHRDEDRLAKVLTLETGKPITQSYNEIRAVGERIRFFLDRAEKTLKPETVLKKRSMTERIEYEPLGVVANISAWNYPYFVGSNVFVPALLTGCSVLYKPSELATLTGAEIARMMREAGVPRDAFVPILGDGRIGAELLRSKIDGVFFTGSYATGAKIAEAAAKNMIKVQLELGGKDPVYVASDADAKNAAASLADGAFYNNGQSCCAVERLYVHSKVYYDFLEAFVEAVKSFKIGDPFDPDTYFGPLTRKGHIETLRAHVRDAKRKGARLLLGGERMAKRGNWFQPTVFDRVDHSMKLMKEETFGPLIGIQRVSSDEQAVKLMNDTDFGLTAGVYSKSPKRAEKILAQVDSGSAYWNCCDRVSPRLPWSGRRHSGVGCTLSMHGISTFLKPKAYHLRAA